MADTRSLPADAGTTIACNLPDSRAEGFDGSPVVQNVGVRKWLIRLVATVSTLAVAAIGADFGAAIYAEFHWARAVRSANDLPFDPWVGILGFPFISQAMRHDYREVEIRAGGVNHPIVGKVSLEATLHFVDLAAGSWLAGPGTKLPVAKLESRIIVDSTHVGRFMGIKDLLVEAPPKETNDATGGTTESGISGSRGLVFTGTPVSAGFHERVSVSVDVSMEGEDHTTLTFTATDVLTGAGTADRPVPADEKQAVLAAFNTSMPGMRLPFSVAPTTEGARGSDVIVEGITTGVTVALDGLNPR